MSELIDLSGEWYCTVKQPIHGEWVVFDAKYTLIQKGVDIEGIVKVKLANFKGKLNSKFFINPGEYAFIIEFSGQLQGNIFTASFRNQRASIPQFGYGIHRVLGPDHFEGKLLAYSIENDEIIEGRITCRRKITPLAKLINLWPT